MPSKHASQVKNLIQGFKQFGSEFIAACKLPSLQCFDSYDHFGCSGGIFLFLMHLVCVWCGVIVTGCERYLKCSLYLPSMSSLLNKKTFCFLMDLAVWDLLPQRRRTVGQNTLLSCQYSNWNPVYVRNSPKIAFWTFSPWGERTFVPQCTANAKKIRFCSETMPCRLFSLLE